MLIWALLWDQENTAEVKVCDFPAKAIKVIGTSTPISQIVYSKKVSCHAMITLQWLYGALCEEKLRAPFNSLHPPWNELLWNWILQSQSRLQMSATPSNIWLQFYKMPEPKLAQPDISNSWFTEIVRDNKWLLFKPLGFGVIKLCSKR